MPSPAESVGYLIGIAVGGLFIAFAAIALVDAMSDDMEEKVNVDDIEINFE